MNNSTNQNDPPRIAIIGGGISGLTAAYRLTKLLPDAHLELFEASERLGGMLQTRREGDYLIEMGADSFIDKLPAAVELCRELGLGDEIIPTNEEPRRALILHNGKLHPVPAGFVQMRPEKLGPMLRSPILSWRGKLRLLAERWIGKPAEVDSPAYDESVASFATRRLGREVMERLVQPLIAGIYTADPCQLSVAATMQPAIDAEREHGSLRRAALAKLREATGESGARYASFVTPRGGLGQLVDALHKQLTQVTIRLNTPVRSVSQSEDQHWLLATNDDRELQSFDGLVIALPAPRAAELLNSVDAELAGELRSIPYASSAVAGLIYRRDQIGDPLDGFGIVVPAVEGRQIVAASFSSIKFPGRTPTDEVLVRVFIGGVLQAELLKRPDDELIRLAKDELADVLKISGEPHWAKLVRWPEKMPQYHVGHLQRVERIEKITATHARLALAGNAYRGVGIPQCVKSGEQSARTLAEAFDA